MNKRILVVDDEEFILGAVCKALRKDNFQITTTQSAREALKILDEQTFDVIITDLMMPEMDGMELLQHIRNLNARGQTIMITGFPTIQTALQMKRLGAFEYLTKPFTRQELRSVVARAIRRGALEDLAQRPPPAHGESSPVYYIPDHAWARIEGKGSAVIGMAWAFASTVGEIEHIRLPEPGDLLDQGKTCAAVLATDGVEHALHTPLSGRVLEVNPGVVADCGLAGRDPEGRGWFLSLDPFDLERERQFLSGPGEAAGPGHLSEGGEEGDTP
ncbi:MAG: glycine cleavage system protein H [Planctomycetota bacterium]|jgi:CheY-like chemotaxis protein/glycine cleavage system H lipoate-binding protein